MEHRYGIKAENRTTKKRELIGYEFYTMEAAELWKPLAWEKRMYRYFRVVKIKDIKSKSTIKNPK